MDTGKIGDNKWILWIVIIVIFAVRDVFRWIEDNPFTFVWILAVIGFIAYFIFNKGDKTPPPTNNNSSPY